MTRVSHTGQASDASPSYTPYDTTILVEPSRPTSVINQSVTSWAGASNTNPAPPGYVSQPQAIPPMTVDRYNPMSMRLDGNRTRGWTNDLWGCQSYLGEWCLSLWCPCVVYSQNRAKIHHLAAHGRALPKNAKDLCSQMCWTYACLTSLGSCWILQRLKRTQTRDRYKIRGSRAGDCCTSLCCPSCSMNQEACEIELEERYLANQHGYTP